MRWPCADRRLLQQFSQDHPEDKGTNDHPNNQQMPAAAATGTATAADSARHLRSLQQPAWTPHATQQSCTACLQCQSKGHDSSDHMPSMHALQANPTASSPTCSRRLAPLRPLARLLPLVSHVPNCMPSPSMRRSSRHGSRLHFSHEQLWI